MARISFDAYQQAASEQSGSEVGFFSLKNDGDEAVVRILHNSSADFDIIAAHPIKVGEYFRKAACLRNPGEATEKCPLCAAGTKLQYRMFVHMIQYAKDEAGNITAKPVVWDRSAKDMSQKLVTMIQEYGPLSDCVFKVRRNGKAGDMQTTYEILFANPNVYRPDLYPKDAAAAFDNYDTLGTKVYNKNYEELVTFLNTGSFPNSQQNNQAAAQSATPPTAPATTTGGYVAETPSAADRPPFDGGMYVGANPPATGANYNAAGAPTRPNRYY